MKDHTKKDSKQPAKKAEQNPQTTLEEVRSWLTNLWLNHKVELCVGAVGLVLLAGVVWELVS